tara:strand:- start:561 stop:1397 length:837 start_codon:yes stop_codon:yes gene_type:complete
MKKLFFILFISLFIFSCDDDDNPVGPIECIDGVEVELWGECYNIDETTSIIYIPFDNNITGTIPPEIGLFENLESLTIKYTGFDQIPTELFDDLLNLRFLDLGYNNFTEIPIGIGNLSNLEFLDLRYNPIEELPSEIGNLTSLIILYIMFTPLTTLPDEIGQLINLEKIVISSSGLKTIPQTIYNLVNLEELILNHNDLEELPDGISNLNSLIQLNLTSNNLTSFPHDLCDLPNIWLIFVSGNNLCEYYDFNCVNLSSQDQSNCCEGPEGQPNWTTCP